jgi:two-component system repressor protein LuxO
MLRPWSKVLDQIPMKPTTAADILLVEDTLSLARLYTEYLRLEPYALTHVETGAAALQAILRRPPDLVLLDLKLPDMNGIEILRRITADNIPSAVVVITADGSIATAVDAMREGAADFVVKPFAADRLRVTLRNALERQRLSKMVQTFKQEVGRDRYCGFIGSSLAMQVVYRMIEAAAASKATVFITGESGTGKEVCAEAIHTVSPRRDKPLVALNCAAIPKDLIESEIFGHVRGAFTGAVAEREGAASRANGGTLFLDEICEMPLDLQAKLLRFVQTGTLTKVGGSRLETVDLRFVCASNRDPRREVDAGRFREDLFYRLHVIPMPLPPLREREGDALEIADHFLEQYAREERKRFAQFAGDVEVALQTHSWPGNVRELQNVVRNIVVMHDGDMVTVDMLPPLIKRQDAALARADPAVANHPPAATNGRGATHDIKPLWQVEKEAIEGAIAACEGNVPRAAVRLEISPSTIYRKLQAWEEKR